MTEHIGNVIYEILTHANQSTLNAINKHWCEEKKREYLNSILHLNLLTIYEGKHRQHYNNSLD